MNLADLRAAFPAPPVSRFAPAPTGRLHLGHVVNAIYVWGVVRALRGRILLRVEDHDRQRCRPEYEADILDDLAWLGFAADEPPVFQRDRDHLYDEALARLRGEGRAYACECSRATIAAAGGTAGNQMRYPGTCAGKGLAERRGRGVRVRLPDEVVEFDDFVHGVSRQHPAAQCGDLLVRDREEQWTYQFAATVDDFAQQVTLVIRGDDLRDSTGRQILLARLLGRGTPPRFLHHPLVMQTASQKLSKSDDATAIAALRASGMTPAEIIGRAAAMVHLIPTPRPVDAADATAIVFHP